MHFGKIEAERLFHKALVLFVEGLYSNTISWNDLENEHGGPIALEEPDWQATYEIKTSEKDTNKNSQEFFLVHATFTLKHRLYGQHSSKSPYTFCVSKDHVATSGSLNEK